MRFLTGLLVLGMSLWTAKAYEIGLVRDGLTATRGLCIAIVLI